MSKDFAQVELELIQITKSFQDNLEKLEFILGEVTDSNGYQEAFGRVFERCEYARSTGRCGELHVGTFSFKPYNTTSSTDDIKISFKTSFKNENCCESCKEKGLGDSKKDSTDVSLPIGGKSDGEGEL